VVLTPSPSLSVKPVNTPNWSQIKSGGEQRQGGRVDAAPHHAKQPKVKMLQRSHFLLLPSAPIRTPRRRARLQFSSWLPWPWLRFLVSRETHSKATSPAFLGLVGCLRGGCNRFGWGRRRDGSSFSSASLHCRRIRARAVVGERARAEMQIRCSLKCLSGRLFAFPFVGVIDGDVACCW
jgi:hypothetical protein